MKSKDISLARRRLLSAMIASGAFMGLNALVPAYGRALGRLTEPSQRSHHDVEIDLTIRQQTLDIAGGTSDLTMSINGTIPGPLVELYESHNAVLKVHNQLPTSSSIHWHGILLPFEMDGVPGVAFPGIDPGTTFAARFPLRQSGTYWYHSHSGLQEQSGVYGPLVIHPAEADPVSVDRDYVVMLSDWTFENPHAVMKKLKQLGGYYNFQERTIDDFMDDIDKAGWDKTIKDRLAWARMRMSPTDIADVTGYTYNYLMNGLHPAGNWTGVFKPGERVRLRVINGSAMSYFNVRIPGLRMTVVAADGQNVKPVDIDEFQIGVAETYDVVVQPTEDRAYTLFAESMDRSGYACGTLAPREGMAAAVPALRERPLRTMADMGMDMGKMKMDRPMGDLDRGSMSDGTPGMPPKVELGTGMEQSAAGPIIARHGPDQHGLGSLTVAEAQRNRLGEPGTGLENVGHRVLVYTDLKRLAQDFDARPPGRELELHLTGNMDRYMWSFDGKKFSEVKGPIEFEHNERLRLILVNDTMMEHSIHLHGMWMELENGHGSAIPRKHTISVKPSERLSALITPKDKGRWAFHCHLLYHMEMGMFRVVRVS
tara:strand:- start:10772 stop:12562 length:1791 start_codon:yes stop_codon:yes gene_type:complete